MEKGVVEEQLKGLVKLQEIDGRLYRLRQELEEQPAQLESARLACRRCEETVKASEERFKKLTLAHKDKEIQLQSQEETIKKFQVQLFQVKTNKEYQAMQQEIQGAKADTSVLEEEIIRLLDELDAAKQDVEARQQEWQAARTALQQEEERVKQESESIKAEIAALMKQREGLVGGVEKSLMSRYERVLKSRNGVALVPVHGEACSGCQMVLTPQGVNEVRLMEKIIQCENCQRILYFPD